MLGFENLRERLLEHLRLSVRSGEATERGLAQKVSISQPHMHNILKGVRGMNAEICDLLLTRLGMTLLDLLDVDEMRRALYIRSREGELPVEVPVLKERLGPGLPFPCELSPFERINIPFRKLSAIETPQAARLSEDPSMLPVLKTGELVLLDFSAQGCNSEDPDELFVVECHDGIGVRWVRRGHGRIYVISAMCRNNPIQWEIVRDRPESPAIRARVIPVRWLNPPEMLYDPLVPPRGIPRGPAPRFGSS